MVIGPAFNWQTGRMSCKSIIIIVTISVSRIISTSTGWISTRFQSSRVRFRYGCRWTVWSSIFDPSRDIAIATNFVFFSISFSRFNSKTTRDRHIVPPEENIRNFVLCRMAPSVITSGDPECQNCFRFVLVVPVWCAQKVRDRSSPFFCWWW